MSPVEQGDSRTGIQQSSSNMALTQHMFATHTPTRIEETGIHCNLCGEQFWTELDMINHLKAHINCSKTDDPFFCKLCEIGLSEKNATKKTAHDKLCRK